MTFTAPPHLIDRLRAEYLEMPGMRLTASQVQRLCGIDAPTCHAVLDALVHLQFLRANEDGTYARQTAVRRSLKTSLDSRLSRFAS